MDVRLHHLCFQGLAFRCQESMMDSSRCIAPTAFFTNVLVLRVEGMAGALWSLCALSLSKHARLSICVRAERRIVQLLPLGINRQANRSMSCYSSSLSFLEPNCLYVYIHRESPSFLLSCMYPSLHPSYLFQLHSPVEITIQRWHNPHQFVCSNIPLPRHTTSALAVPSSIPNISRLRRSSHL